MENPITQDVATSVKRNAMRDTPVRQKRKRKTKKDPNAPKHPSSDYMLWLNDNRESIRNIHFPKNEDGEHCYPDGHENAGKPLVKWDNMTMITKKAGMLWAELSDDDRIPYKLRFEKLSVAYKEAMCVFNSSKSKKKYDIEEIPQAPEGWSGPHKMMYLSKVSKNPKTMKNFRSFKTFGEALEAANVLDEGCAGITKTSTGYSLRIGQKLIETPGIHHLSGIASWTKNLEKTKIVIRPTPSPRPSKTFKKISRTTQHVAEIGEKKMEVISQAVNALREFAQCQQEAIVVFKQLSEAMIKSIEKM